FSVERRQPRLTCRRSSDYVLWMRTTSWPAFAENFHRSDESLELRFLIAREDRFELRVGCFPRGHQLFVQRAHLLVQRLRLRAEVGFDRLRGGFLTVREIEIVVERGSARRWRRRTECGGAGRTVRRRRRDREGCDQQDSEDQGNDAFHETSLLLGNIALRRKKDFMRGQELRKKRKT